MKVTFKPVNCKFDKSSEEIIKYWNQNTAEGNITIQKKNYLFFEILAKTFETNINDQTHELERLECFLKTCEFGLSRDQIEKSNSAKSDSDRISNGKYNYR